ncbi:MAG: hypothetical protein HC828_01745 [Blastochloris sp.]|nr:hypothetical protein [Blastochloris sp.]
MSSPGCWKQARSGEIARAVALSPVSPEADAEQQGRQGHQRVKAAPDDQRQDAEGVVQPQCINRRANSAEPAQLYNSHVNQWEQQKSPAVAYGQTADNPDAQTAKQDDPDMQGADWATRHHKCTEERKQPDQQGTAEDSFYVGAVRPIRISGVGFRPNAAMVTGSHGFTSFSDSLSARAATRQFSPV